MPIQVQPCCCDCFWCVGTMPPEMAVTFSGLADFAVPTCETCDEFNTTYICQLETRILPPFTFGTKDARGAKNCEWIYRFEPAVCGIVAVAAGYFRDPPEPWRLQVELIKDALNAGSSIIWVRYLEEKPSCYFAQDTNVPFLTYSGSAHSVCEATGSTAYVTALR
jgi:hypothetical protein